MKDESFIKFSMCDMLKKGIGSSSSHTLAPWLSAKACYGEIQHDLPSLKAVEVELFGSLAFVGRGHYTTLALPLGLLGKDPADFILDRDLKNTLRIGDIRDLVGIDKLYFDGGPTVDYSVKYNTHDDKDHERMDFNFTWADGKQKTLTYYSYGGGSYGRDIKPPKLYEKMKTLHYPYDCADALLNQLNGITLAEAIYKNEIDFALYRFMYPSKEYQGLPTDESMIVPFLKDIAVQMGKLIFGGLTHEEEDIGYAHMYAHTRAKQMFLNLFGPNPPGDDGADWANFLRLMRLRSKDFGFDRTTDLIGTLALAVAEQNAALQNVVTAPTNGACGAVPAVLYYYVLFHAGDDEVDWLFDGKPGDDGSGLNNICRFLLVANAVGGIVKANANIAGGLGGCQAEIGTASAMAAGALTSVLGGGAEKAFQAAEAALEAHLGSTCDPVGGLVEVPCIERNLTAAVTAISVSFEMLVLDPGFETVVPFDKVVETMENISQQIDPELKERSTGGLAKTMREDARNKRPDLFPENMPSIADGELSVFRTTC